MTFDTEEDLRKEKKAIDTFVNTFGGSYKKLDPQDIDYKIFDKDKNLIAYAEVKIRIRTMNAAYPLPITVRKISKLADKRLNPLMIWSCEDGIIYGKVNKLRGSICFDTSSELMVYYDKQKELKYVRFV
jgi:hypothetical protein